MPLNELGPGQDGLLLDELLLDEDASGCASRRAVDSTDEPMSEIFSLRIPYELRILGGRRARLMGLSLGEYMRYLLARDVDSGDDSVHVRPQSKALRTRG